MKKQRVIICTTFMLVLGFVIGFFRGELVYLWIFRFFPDDVNLFDVIVGIATVSIAGIAICQTNRANKTNERIANMEESSLIFAHAPIVAIKSTSFEYNKNIVVNYEDTKIFNPQVLIDHLHKEKSNLRQIKVTANLNVLSGAVSLVEVESARIVLSDEKNSKGQHAFSAKGEFEPIESNTGFSSVAIYPDGNIAFSVSLLATKDNFLNIQKVQMHGMWGYIELNIKLLSHMSIMSKYKCRVHFEPSNNNEIGELVTSTKQPPLSFQAKEKPMLLNRDEVKILEVKGEPK